MLWMFLEFRQIVFPRNSTKVEITQLKEKKKKSVTLLKYYLESNPYETKSHNFEGFRSIIVFSGYDRDGIKF